MKIIVKSAKMKYFSKEEVKIFNFSPTIRRIKNIETQVGFLDTDNKALVNELKTNELFLFVEGEEEVESEVKVEVESEVKVEGEEEVKVEETKKPLATKNKPIKK